MGEAVATVDALRRVLDVGRDDGFGGGRKLELRLASNLDAIVLDEVDALLPPPALRGQAVYRRMTGKGGEGRRPHGAAEGGAAPSSAGSRARRVVGTERRRLPQIVGVGDGKPRCCSSCERRSTPTLWGATRGTRARCGSCPPSSACPSGCCGEVGGRGVAGVGVPTELRHWIATPAPQTPEGVAAALRTLRPRRRRAARSLLPDREGVSLNAWITRCAAPVSRTPSRCTG